MPAAALTCREVAAVAVPGAAQVHDVGGLVRADAVVTIDGAEHARRAEAGLGAVTDIDVLQALMCLPLHVTVPVADLGDVTRRLLRKAPTGCLDWGDNWKTVRRRFVPAASVPLVLVRGATWRAALRRAATFEPFAARVVLLTRRPRRVADITWEADVDGAGLWITHPSSGGSDSDTSGAGEIEEIVAPEPYVERYVKPAKWRFAEYAYGAWLTHRAGTAASTDPGSITARPVAGPGEQLTF